MPWTPEDAISHNKQAKTPRLKKIWSSAANAALEQYQDEGRAVAVGNAAVNRARRSKKAEAEFLLKLLLLPMVVLLSACAPAGVIRHDVCISWDDKTTSLGCLPNQ